jgi:hypothetical protein
MSLRRRILHRWALLGGTVIVVVVACTTEGPRGNDDDDGSTPGSGGGTSSSSGQMVTDMCEMQCEALHPNGVTLYNNIRLCLLCHGCADVCKQETGGICVDGMVEGGCSAQFMSCAECINSPCALEQVNDSMLCGGAPSCFMGVCAANATECSNNVDCVEMNNCVFDCVMMQGAASSTGSGASSTAMSSGATMSGM